jgi:hypothetical protein
MINPVKQVKHFFAGGIIKLDGKGGKSDGGQQNDCQNND